MTEQIKDTHTENCMSQRCCPHDWPRTYPSAPASV